MVTKLVILLLGLSLVSAYVHKSKKAVTISNPYEVVKVYDGDTITVKNDTATIKVRLICVDAPEKSQEPWGDKSQANLEKLTPIGSKVTLAGYTLDKYKRILAVVINNKNVKVNNKQLEDGMAVFYPKQSGCNEYKELEKKVQPTHKGVYGDPNFVNPWDYRSENKAKRKIRSGSINASL